MNTRKLMTRALPILATAVVLTGCNSSTEPDDQGHAVDNNAATHSVPDTPKNTAPQDRGETQAEGDKTEAVEDTVPDPTCDTGTFYDPETPAGISNFGAKPDMYRITEPVTIEDVTGPTTVRMPIKGTMTTVTLLGVDPSKDADAARQHLKNLIGDQNVILEYEPTQGVTTANGETQGYLWTANAEGKPTVLINTVMIADKYGTPAASTGHAPHRLSDSFSTAANN